MRQRIRGRNFAFIYSFEIRIREKRRETSKAKNFSLRKPTINALTLLEINSFLALIKNKLLVLTTVDVVLCLFVAVIKKKENFLLKFVPPVKSNERYKL